MKTGGALANTAPASVDTGNLSNQEMAQKLLQYQQFMAKYIIEAQQQKLKAVQAAEIAVKKNYEEKLRLLSGSAPVEPAAPAVSADDKLFQDRNAKVSAAAKAGKSRWGDMENQKATIAASAAPKTVAPADSGANGVAVAGAAVPPATNVGQSLFDQRNAKIAAAGKAGKSRWGDMEVKKATELTAALPAAPSKPVPAAAAAAAAPVPPEVAEADHGLRNDGGVGGPSLAERVNLGAQLFDASAAAAAPAAPVAAASVGPSLYDKRNARIAAAGKAGKSRWGDLEIIKATDLAAALPASSASAAPVVAAAPVPPEVEAADHGLRADGGVGGPSLAQRVNLGAAMLGQ